MLLIINILFSLPMVFASEFYFGLVNCHHELKSLPLRLECVKGKVSKHGMNKLGELFKQMETLQSPETSSAHDFILQQLAAGGYGSLAQDASIRAVFDHAQYIHQAGFMVPGYLMQLVPNAKLQDKAKACVLFPGLACLDFPMLKVMDVQERDQLIDKLHRKLSRQYVELCTLAKFNLTPPVEFPKGKAGELMQICSMRVEDRSQAQASMKAWIGRYPELRCDYGIGVIMKSMALERERQGCGGRF